MTAEFLPNILVFLLSFFLKFIGVIFVFDLFIIGFICQRYKEDLIPIFKRNKKK